MKWTGVKCAVAGLVAVVGATGLVACDNFEPSGRKAPDTGETIHIAVHPSSAEHWVLSKMYETVFNNQQRLAVLWLDDTLPRNPLNGLNDGTADLVIVCTGSFLAKVDPVLATELEEEYVIARESGKTDVNSGEWRDRTYAALLGSLPDHLATGDPSNAEGCEGANDLPQNIVPVYRKPAFNRERREILNWVSGAITTEDLDKMTEVTRREGRAEEVVEEYVASKGG